VPDLTEAERKTISYALRHPRGRYDAERTSQLSGVPRSTIYDWRREEIFRPDYDTASPVMWSYRDLVLLRLLAWLRQGGMPRPTASSKVCAVKAQLSGGAQVRFILATRDDVVLEDGDGAGFPDDRENLLPFDNFFSLLSPFDLHEPIEELRSTRGRPVWAPDLVTPSAHSFISPWVLAGDPCVRRTRIPTATVHALSTERALPIAAILQLYPALTAAAAKDAIALEVRLRGRGAVDRSAA
jgi:uncharacterized protein (DUF433 family)